MVYIVNLRTNGVNSQHARQTESLARRISSFYYGELSLLRLDRPSKLENSRLVGAMLWIPRLQYSRTTSARSLRCNFPSPVDLAAGSCQQRQLPRRQGSSGDKDRPNLFTEFTHLINSRVISLVFSRELTPGHIQVVPITSWAHHIPGSPRQLKALAPRPAKDCARARTCMLST